MFVDIHFVIKKSIKKGVFFLSGYLCMYKRLREIDVK